MSDSLASAFRSGSVLKYRKFDQHRLGDALTNDRISTIAIAIDCVVIGTENGCVHVVSLESVPPRLYKSYKSHDRPVNAISLDGSGQIIASCSDNGTVVIGSTTVEDNSKEVVVHFTEPIKSLCLEDSNNITSNNANSNRNRERSFMVGTSSGKLIHHRAQWFAHKNIVLFKGSNVSVSNIAWKNNLVAWADTYHVRIMDISTQTAVCYINCPIDNIDVNNPLPCHLVWDSGKDLLIGWADCYRHVELKAPHNASSEIPGNYSESGNKYSNSDVSGNSTTNSEANPVSSGDEHHRYIAKTVCTWNADCIICGISTFDIGHVVILGYVPPLNGSNKDFMTPECIELQVVRRSDGALIFADILPMNNTGLNGPWDHRLLSTYQFPQYNQNSSKWNLADIIDMKRGVQRLAPIFFILTDSDIVVSEMRDINDRVGLALKERNYLLATNMAHNDRVSLTKYNYHDIITLYLNDLLEKNETETACNECKRLLGSDPALWERWIYTFARKNALSKIVSVIPTSNPRLNEEVYEVVIAFFFHSNSESLLNVVMDWGAIDPPLFNHQELIARLERYNKKNDIYCVEALAKMYMYSSLYEKAVNCYLNIDSSSSQNKNSCAEDSSCKYQEVFELIETHDLFDAVKDKYANLIRLSKESASILFVKIEKLPVATVVKQLSSDRKLLHWYLHLLFTKIPDVYNNNQEYAPYHKLQVGLYAEFAPKFKKKRDNHDNYDSWSSPEVVLNSNSTKDSEFLTFLKVSSFAPLDYAMQECEKCNPKLYPEIVYIYAKNGNKKEALKLLLHEISDVSQAIDFLYEYLTDQELWKDLTDYALQNTDFLAKLLDFIGNCDINPKDIVDKIPSLSTIAHLRHRMLRLINQKGFQAFLSDKCNDVLEDDTLKLLKTLNQRQRKALKVDPNTRCSVCARPLFIPPGTSVDKFTSNSSYANQVIWAPMNAATLPGASIIFSNKIAFHRKCYDGQSKKNET